MLSRSTITGLLFLILISGASQNLFAQLPIIGKSFFAVTVKNADSVANWYVAAFQLKSLKEINDTAMGVVVRIIGNDNMVIEILQMKDSKTSKDWGLKSNFQVHGFVKVGFFVRSLDEVEKSFSKKNIRILHLEYGFKSLTKLRCLVILSSHQVVPCLSMRLPKEREWVISTNLSRTQR